MYEPGYDFSPMERQQMQQQQQQHILQKLDSAQFFQDALRVATYHPYNSPTGLYANSPLGGFTAAAAGYTPSNSFAAAAAFNVLNGMPPQSQFAHMQQQQQQQQAENGSMAHNNNNNNNTNDLTSIEDTQNNFDTMEPSVAAGMEQEEEREVDKRDLKKKRTAALQYEGEFQSYSTILDQSQNKVHRRAQEPLEKLRKVQNYYQNNLSFQGQASPFPRHPNKSQNNLTQQHFPEYYSQQHFLPPHHKDLLLPNHQQTQWHLQMQQNTNQHIPFCLYDNSQAIPSGVGAGSSITPQNIGRAFNFYDIPAIDSPQQGFTPSYYASTASVTANGNNMLGSNFNRQTSSQQQQQQQMGAASTSSANANYSFSSVAAALKGKNIHANVQQFYDSPGNFCGASAFLPFTPQSVKASCFQSFMQAASDSLKQPILHENDEGSPIHFLQTPVQQQYQQFQESLTPRQIFNPSQHLQHQHQLSFQQQQQQASQIFQQSQPKQGLNLLQQQQQLKQMQRYNQEKVLLQQQQFQIEQQARIASQQQFQNGSHNEQAQKETSSRDKKEQEQLQIQQKQENATKQQQQKQDKVQKQDQQLLGVEKQDSLPIDSRVIQKEGSSEVALIDKNKRNKGKLQSALEENQEQIDEEEEEEENENESEIQSEEDQDQGEDDNDEEDIQDGDEDYCENGRNGTKRRNNGSHINSNKQDLKKIKKISKNKPTSSKVQQKVHSRKQINETKNIPKNYSKAIIGFIQKHPDECSQLLGKDYSFNEFEKFLVDRKEKLTAIKDLRSLWTTVASNPKQEAFNRVFRILSFKFFRENAVAYIYSSRKIKNTKALITYRFILQRALHDPESFQFMKLQN